MAIKQGNKNPNVGLWPTKSGKGYSVYLNEKVIRTLQECEEGGTLFLNEVEEAAREENAKAPHYRLTIYPPREADAKSPPAAKDAV